MNRKAHYLFFTKMPNYSCLLRFLNRKISLSAWVISDHSSIPAQICVCKTQTQFSEFSVFFILNKFLTHF